MAVSFRLGTRKVEIKLLFLPNPIMLMFCPAIEGLSADGLAPKKVIAPLKREPLINGPLEDGAFPPVITMSALVPQQAGLRLARIGYELVSVNVFSN